MKTLEELIAEGKRYIRDIYTAMGPSTRSEGWDIWDFIESNGLSEHVTLDHYLSYLDESLGEQHVVWGKFKPSTLYESLKDHLSEEDILRRFTEHHRAQNDDLIWINPSFDPLNGRLVSRLGIEAIITDAKAGKLKWWYD